MQQEKNITALEKALSSAPLSAQQFDDYAASNDKIVISSICGSGKTLRAIEFMSKHWRNGILYVSERKEQLAKVKEALIMLGVPEQEIQVYHCDVENKTEVRKKLNDAYVVLVTHYRLLIDSPTAFVAYGSPIAPRHYLIIDEALPPITVLTMPRMFAQGLLTSAGVTLDYNDADPDNAHAIISKINTELDLHSVCKFSRMGITYSHPMGMKDTEYTVAARKYILKMALIQILLQRCQIDDAKIDIVVPLAPHLYWARFFKQVIALDATAEFSRFLYQDFNIVSPSSPDYSLISNLYVHKTDFDLSKTKLMKNLHAFLDENVPYIKAWMQEGFTNPYVVTFKGIEESIQDRLELEVTHYGANRGSNEFSNRDSAVLLGAYNLPVKYARLAQRIYPDFDSTSLAVGHWIQEIFRTRIRSGNPINLFYMGDTKATNYFENLLGRRGQPTVIQRDGREYLEEALRSENRKMRREILSRIKNNDSIDLNDVARTHGNRDINKARHAYSGLLKSKPYLTSLLERQGDIVTWIARPINVRDLQQM